MKNEYNITTAEVLRYLDSIGLPQKANELFSKANTTRRPSDIEDSNFANKCLDFAVSIKTQAAKYRRELTPPQKKFAIVIIKKFANPSQLFDWDLGAPQTKTKSALKEEKNKLLEELAETESLLKETVEILNELLNTYYTHESYADEPWEPPTRETDREKSRLEDKVRYLNDKIDKIKKSLARFSREDDKSLILALTEIQPFFTADANDVAKIIQERKAWAEQHGRDWKEVKLVDWLRKLVVDFLSDYREQINPETLKEIQHLIPSESERSQFFVKFTPQYIEFMVRAVDASWGSGLIQKTAEVSEFLKTGGRGGTSTGRRYRDTTAAWIKKVETIQKKLEGNSTKLGGLGEYINSPQSLTKLANEMPVNDIISSLSGVKEYSLEEREAATLMMKHLRNMDPDKAKEENYVGFSKPDSYKGHRLAEFDVIPNEWMPQAIFFCNKYRGQLIGAGFEPYLAELGLIKGKKKVKITTQTTDIARYLSVCFM